MVCAWSCACDLVFLAAHGLDVFPGAEEGGLRPCRHVTRVFAHAFPTLDGRDGGGTSNVFEGQARHLVVRSVTVFCRACPTRVDSSNHACCNAHLPGPQAKAEFGMNVP